MPFVLGAFLLSLVSWVFYRRAVKHKLSIGYFSLSDLSLHHVHYHGSAYSDTYHFRFSAARVYLRFHLPRQPNRRWLTFVAEGIFYTSETFEMSASQLSVAFWFFPLLFKQTAGPWTNVELDECRIRIMRGDQTPYWIKRIRESIVGAVIVGEVLRADDFKTSIQFQGVTEPIVEPEEYAYEEKDGREYKDCCPDHATSEDICSSGIASCYCSRELTMPTPDPNLSVMDDDRIAPERRKPGKLRRLLKGSNISTPPPSLCHADDEMCISSCVRGLQLHDCEGRIYSFAKVDAQLRRNWTADRGTFVMVAEECGWVRVPSRHRMAFVTSWWRQLASSILHFPYDLIHIYHRPASAMNVHLPRLNIVFDEFKIRDAELIMQAFSLVREKMVLSEFTWQDMLLDFLANAALGSRRSSSSS